MAQAQGQTRSMAASSIQRRDVRGWVCLAERRKVPYLEQFQQVVLRNSETIGQRGDGIELLLVNI
eukprot:3717541-Pyramimonas_sp.AAC.2